MSTTTFKSGTPPSPEQNDTQDAVHLELYQYDFCPYCIDVREEIDRLSLCVRYRDVLAKPRYRQELRQVRGRGTVPVLKITRSDGSIEWMPESRDIIRYLRSLNPGSTHPRGWLPF